MINFNLLLRGIEYPATIQQNELIIAILANGNGKSIEIIIDLLKEILKEKENPIVAIKLKEVLQLLKINL